MHNYRHIHVKNLVGNLCEALLVLKHTYFFHAMKKQHAVLGTTHCFYISTLGQAVCGHYINYINSLRREIVRQN